MRCSTWCATLIRFEILPAKNLTKSYACCLKASPRVVDVAGLIYIMMRSIIGCADEGALACLRSPMAARFPTPRIIGSYSSRPKHLSAHLTKTSQLRVWPAISFNSEITLTRLNELEPERCVCLMRMDSRPRFPSGWAKHRDVQMSCLLQFRGCEKRLRNCLMRTRRLTSVARG